MNPKVEIKHISEFETDWKDMESGLGKLMDMHYEEAIHNHVDDKNEQSLMVWIFERGNVQMGYDGTLAKFAVANGNLITEYFVSEKDWDYFEDIANSMTDMWE